MYIFRAKFNQWMLASEIRGQAHYIIANSQFSALNDAGTKAAITKHCGRAALAQGFVHSRTRVAERIGFDNHLTNVKALVPQQVHVHPGNHEIAAQQTRIYVVVAGMLANLLDIFTADKGDLTSRTWSLFHPVIAYKALIHHSLRRIHHDHLTASFTAQTYPLQLAWRKIRTKFVE